MLFKWIWFSVKRNLKSIPFYLMLLILIVTYVVMSDIEARHSDEMEVLLYTEASDYGQNIIDRLTGVKSEGNIVYSIAKNEDDLKSRVIKGQAICGIVFKKGLDEAIKSNDPDGEIVLCMPPDSVNGFIIREAVYPYVMQCMSKDILERYLKRKEPDLPQDELETILTSYEEKLNSTTVEIFNTAIIDTDSENIEVKELPKEGMISKTVLVIILLLFAIISYEMEMKADKYYFKCHKQKDRYLLCSVSTIVTIGMLFSVFLIALVFI